MDAISFPSSRSLESNLMLARPGYLTRCWRALWSFRFRPVIGLVDETRSNFVSNALTQPLHRCHRLWWSRSPRGNEGILETRNEGGGIISINATVTMGMTPLTDVRKRLTEDKGEKRSEGKKLSEAKRRKEALFNTPLLREAE